MRTIALVAAAVTAPQVIMRLRAAGHMHPITSARLRPADAALVLGARVWADGRPSRFLRERVEGGAVLYHSGLVQTVILSGAANNREGLNETEAMYGVAIDSGVNPLDIVLDGEGVTTAASARGVAAMEGIASVIVVSQEFHVPRAIWLCRAQGLHAQGAYPPVTARQPTRIGYARELGASWKAVLGPVLATPREPAPEP